MQVIAWRTVSEMTYNVMCRALNLTHSLIHSDKHCSARALIHSWSRIPTFGSHDQIPVADSVVTSTWWKYLNTRRILVTHKVFENYFSIPKYLLSIPNSKYVTTAERMAWQNDRQIS